MAALKNYVDNVITAANRVTAAWLNQVDVFVNTLFNGATTAVQARAALGSSTVGDAVFIAANAAAGRSALGAAASGVNTDITSLLAAPVTSFVRGCNCVWNSGTPNTMFDLNANAVVLTATGSQAATVQLAPGALTNNVGTAGSAANGRDQAGAFTPSTFIHFYWIWNGTTLATLSSATAPPTGPTLPTTYTHWAYAGAVYFDSSSHLIPTRFKGAWAYLDTPNAALTSGSASTETAIVITAVVPSNALEFRVNYAGGFTGSGGFDSLAKLRIITAKDYFVTRVLGQNATSSGFGCEVTLPNISQTLYYLFTPTTNISAATISLWVTGYKMPNGGE